MSQRKSYRPEFNAKAALEAIKGGRTINEIAADLGVHPMLLTSWKKQAMERLPRGVRQAEQHDRRRGGVLARPSVSGDRPTQGGAGLAQKKSLAGPLEARRVLIDPSNPMPSIVRQCELVGLARSTWYYEPVGET